MELLRGRMDIQILVAAANMGLELRVGAVALRS